MKKLKIKNEKLVFSILIISLFVLFLLYYNFVFSVVFARNSFANEMIEIADENENSIFNIQKILLYSSANAIDNSKNHSLRNMSICQYSDLSIYIDNTIYISELTNENTIKIQFKRIGVNEFDSGGALLSFSDYFKNIP